MNSETSNLNILVVGASAAGLRAAARARRLLPDAKVVVLDRAEEISVGACGLPYVLSGDVEDANSLRRTSYELLRDPAFFAAVKDLDVRTGHTVETLDLEAHRISGRTAAGAAFELTYDRLVIATGGDGVLPFAGVEPTERIRHLRTLEDVRLLKAGLMRGQIGRVAVVGGGFIGCEAAEACASLWGAEVTLIEALPQVLGQMLDVEMAAVVESHLRTQEVALRLGAPVSNLRDTGEGVVVELADGGTIEADAAIVALGVRPATGFAVDAGLSAGPNGALVVDGQMRTSHPDVYAAGDCVLLRHHVSGRPLYLPLGSLANRHGRVIADNLAGREREAAPVVGSAVAKVFDVNAAATGLTEAEARAAGLQACVAWGTFDDLADYYPEAATIHCKVVYEAETHRLLGVQVVGPGRVTREVDVAAVLLQSGATIDRLHDLEFAYAPPFSGAVAPLQHMAAVLLNAEDGPRVLPPGTELGEAVVVDVREADEVEARPIEGVDSLAVPLAQVRSRLEEIPPGRVVVVCAHGVRSYEVSRILRENGREADYIGGGMSLRSNWDARKVPSVSYPSVQEGQ